eukprot:CAMPEP_0183360936 /NCGR_PEP_ID=MMETSP0164_2-20130417/56157_1 /TAXON_ID=221442 /ORGANISM="Coccolithus pelagicus ssp braarudi, Strain PLY182g" /LENGTH=84 /DNA_ID=CAMNT_0025535385 /DNA_START=135 /DNA_END=389 /DNA_ORIENTATION=+
MAEPDEPSPALANETPEPSPSLPSSGSPKSVVPEGMDRMFLGIFDMSTRAGALGASIVVSVAFVTVVEGIKWIDPNPAAPSIFG